MKELKIIDLLNKIAKKETLPKTIRYDYRIWKLGVTKTIITDEKYIDYLDDLNYGLFESYCHDFICILNDNVEILE